MMKIVAYYRKIPLKVFLILLVFLPYQNQAQSVKRQCISSYSSIGASGYASFMQTVGQSYNTSTSYESKTSILPGFQQPVVFKVEKIYSEPLRNINLNVYPNPAAYLVIIQSDEPGENLTLHVMDITGKLIMTENKAQLQTYSVNCAGWPDGIYFITVSDKNQRKSSVKLVIKK